MDSDTFDSANPFFKYDLHKICGVCAKKLEIAKTHSLNEQISDSGDIMVYQVLESVSNFKFQENGTAFICQTCFNNTCETYKFQRVCNKTQFFFDKFIEHQSKLSEELLPIEHIKVEEVDINVDYDGEAIGTRKEAKKRPCKVCNKLISTNNMVKHQRIHTGEKPFKCQHCDATFNAHASLKFHTLSHENKRNYVCQFCANAFNNPGCLQKHVRIHTGYRPHQCMKCNMSFTTKHGLQRHMIIHTNEKPYTCEFCQKSYNRKSNLTVHQMIHTGERPHSCTICDRSFITSRSLQIHLQAHSKRETKSRNKEVQEVSSEISSNDAYNGQLNSFDDKVILCD